VGMWDGVAAPRGTSHTLDDLPFPICAKTGSAQVHDNSQENALFVGYAPCTLASDVAATGAGNVPPTSASYNQEPQIALLILIENSKQGSLNAVPIAKQVLNWYYENRLAPGVSAANAAIAASVATGTSSPATQ
jgi:penicillin-binding protein 2